MASRPYQRPALRKAFFSATLALSLTACGGGGATSPNTGTATAAVITLITVTPAVVTLVVGQTQGLTAVAYDANGIVVPNTFFTWSGSDNNGELSGTFTGNLHDVLNITAVKPVVATLRATAGAVSGIATVTVQ